MIFRSRRTVTLLLAVLLIAGCASSAPAPVINKSPHRKIPAERVVKSGESIYAISWQYGVDFLDIAKWNGLKPPYRLNAGQRLSLRPGAITRPAPVETPVVTAPLPADPAPTSGALTTEASSPTANTQTPATVETTAAKTPLAAPTRWQWPAKGEIIARYSRSKGVNGIRIAGQAGSPVRASAAGDVVYVGEGLLGYGKLVIVKHSTKYLSAYAHNRQILVKEGDRVSASQQIAEMGNSGAEQTMLHFEIRVNGKPEDPLKYLR